MSKPKIAQKVLGDGAELYEFLLGVVRGEVCDKKWVKERYGEVEVNTPANVKVRSDVARWLIEQLHGRAGTTLAVTTDASAGLVNVSQLPTEVLERLVGAGVTQKSLQENISGVQVLPDEPDG